MQTGKKKQGCLCVYTCVCVCVCVHMCVCAFVCLCVGVGCVGVWVRAALVNNVVQATAQAGGRLAAGTVLQKTRGGKASRSQHVRGDCGPGSRAWHGGVRAPWLSTYGIGLRRGASVKHTVLCSTAHSTPHPQARTLARTHSRSICRGLEETVST